EDEAEDCDCVVGIALVRGSILRQGRKHAKKDRDERDREADRDEEGRPLRPLVGDRPQRPEQSYTQYESEPEPQARVGKTLALSVLRILRLEEPHLPEQRARDRELDRDHRLKELNGHFHESAKY